MTNIDKAIRTYEGQVTAANEQGTVQRIEFPNGAKASAFCDEITTDTVSAERQFSTNPKAVVVTEV